MRNYLESFAIADNNKRREFIIKKLEEMNCPYFIQREKMGNEWVQNIIVKLKRNNPRIVIGAHYDTFYDDNAVSTGANDNGTGVCILLKYIEDYIKSFPNIPQVPVEFVFFDAEEGKLFGSQAYLNRVLESDIKAFINLDSCGVGDTIVITPKKNIEGELGQTIDFVNKLGKYNVEIVEKYLPSDDLSFELRGVRNISVCTLENDDIETMEQIAGVKQGEKPEIMPKIFETMHNGIRDSIDCIDNNSMEMTLNWLKDVISSFK